MSTGKNIVCFDNPYLFFEQMGDFNFNIPIYNDSELGQEKKGEEFAKDIYDKGFKEIYLATGHLPEYFPQIEWIKWTKDKAPPWIN
ncbi:hypothetical protein GCL60_14775 [Silvanigrella paludirubra]|uniref:Uncharacterized protein n=1 Tax=Silvanigrella paludirubra TaxID=2499159 RepID=A0A6N6VVI9_9BACT|nr:hypothetical protein [Silvanigrella paludirubra]KAB8037091.1 hypothetical protein GCL60_14775 [Silvanigrella paludirubra]